MSRTLLLWSPLSSCVSNKNTFDDPRILLFDRFRSCRKDQFIETLKTDHTEGRAFTQGFIDRVLFGFIDGSFGKFRSPTASDYPLAGRSPAEPASVSSDICSRSFTAHAFKNSSPRFHSALTPRRCGPRATTALPAAASPLPPRSFCASDCAAQFGRTLPALSHRPAEYSRPPG